MSTDDADRASKKRRPRYSSKSLEKLLKAAEKRGRRLRKAGRINPDRWQRPFTI